MASIVGFGSELYRATTWPAVSGFFESTRMSAWFFHDACKWIDKLQPESTRAYINLSAAASLAGGVEDFCDGPYECVEHVVSAGQKGWRILQRNVTGRQELVYQFAKELLSTISSAVNTLKLLDKVGALQLRERLTSLTAIGHSSSLVKATAEIIENGARFRNASQRAGETQGHYTRRVSTYFFDIVKKVSLFAMKVLSLAGIAFGIATSSTIMLALSSVMLGSFIVTSFFKTADGIDHAGISGNWEAGD